MQKKTFIWLSSASLAIGITTAALIGLRERERERRLSPQADIVPGGVLTLDAADPNLDFQAGKFTAKSKAGNDFTFSNAGMTLSDGVFTIEDGYLHNETPLNGIYKMVFASAADNQVLSYSYTDGYGNDGESIKIDKETMEIGFNFDPNAITIDAKGNTLSFTSVTYYYTCIDSGSNTDIVNLRTSTIGGYSAEYNALFGQNGTLLSSLDISDVTFFSSYGYGILGSEVTNFTIAYTESNSTAVLPGLNEVEFSFVYDETTYTGTGLTLFGYDHCEQSASSYSLFNSAIKIRDNDSLPEGIMLDVRADLMIYASEDPKGELIQTEINSKVELTAGMVESYDANPFTVIGDHTMTVNYSGIEKEIRYEIYDPEYNNVRYLSQNSLSVPAGTTSEEFIDYMSTQTVYVGYYEDTPELPHEIILTASNFTLKGDEFDGSKTSVFVPVHYGNYSTSFTVTVQVEKGNLVKTYTNEEGVMVFGTAYRIDLYDNNLCDVYYKNAGTNPQTATCSLDGTTLTMTLVYGDAKVTLDDENDTFTAYVNPKTPLYTLDADLTALGAPAQEKFYIYIYDDDTLDMDVGGGMVISFPFTYDENDNKIIYFDFAAGPTPTPVVGTIDYEKNTIVVVPVQA